MNTSAGLAGTIRRQTMKGKGKPKKMPMNLARHARMEGESMAQERKEMRVKKKGKK